MKVIVLCLHVQVDFQPFCEKVRGAGVFQLAATSIELSGSIMACATESAHDFGMLQEHAPCRKRSGNRVTKKVTEASEIRNILAPIKIKSALPPPPQKKNQNTPLENEDFYGHGGFPAERTQFFQASIKFAHPFPAPELRAIHFTDTRIFSEEKLTEK